MTQIKIENIQKIDDPIDIVEEVVLANGWDYERDDNKNIHVQVGGNWCDYQLSYGLNERGNIIYISCGFESFKRDLSYLKETHEIKRMAMFDQFPYTEHIESGAILSRKAPN